jgi:hypothetical protein
MFLSFPDPKISAERLANHPGPRPVLEGTGMHLGEPTLPLAGYLFVFLAELQRLQRDTVLAIADHIIGEARKFELSNKTITFEELNAAGLKLTEYAKTIVPGDNLVEGGQ